MKRKLLAGGKSGARVYDIGGEYVLKQIYRRELGNDDLRSTDEEIAILMKRYQTLSRQEINRSLLKKIMRTLAYVLHGKSQRDL